MGLVRACALEVLRNEVEDKVLLALMLAIVIEVEEEWLYRKS